MATDDNPERGRLSAIALLNFLHGQLARTLDATLTVRDDELFRAVDAVNDGHLWNDSNEDNFHLIEVLSALLSNDPMAPMNAYASSKLKAAADDIDDTGISGS